MLFLQLDFHSIQYHFFSVTGDSRGWLADPEVDHEIKQLFILQPLKKNHESKRVLISDSSELYVHILVYNFLQEGKELEHFRVILYIYQFQETTFLQLETHTHICNHNEEITYQYKYKFIYKSLLITFFFCKTLSVYR